ncbi:hypothetical protein DSO57_1024305 [Entomophthora muscae]|uniref:Uncharacterized protein n=1 Tax=Entomophthora muscae TaxID=34485 RepID=A0ACC2T2N7_9FUNG|nr:hypothetical protein DSO57_1024305 [Entomophthora muscae]
MCIRSNELSGKAKNVANAKPISRVPSKAINNERTPIKGAVKPINNAKSTPAGKGASKGNDERTISKTPSKAINKPISISKPSEGSKNIGSKKPNLKQGVIGDKLVESNPVIDLPSDDIIIDTEIPNSDPIVIDGMPVVDLPGTGKRVGGAKRGGVSKKVIKVASGAASSLKNMIFAKHFRLDHKA